MVENEFQKKWWQKNEFLIEKFPGSPLLSKKIEKLNFFKQNFE